jgi:hypothetical protein
MPQISNAHAIAGHFAHSLAAFEKFGRFQWQDSAKCYVVIFFLST